MALTITSGTTTRTLIRGEAGDIELLIDSPKDAVQGIAVVGHPHPMQGGTADHKVPHQLARELSAHGFLAVRPNFRGVGATQGEHDAGVGETNDMLAVVDHLREQYPGLPLALAGFSFGAFVAALASVQLTQRGVAIDHLILTGMPSGPVANHRSYDTPPVPANALVIHGENDERVALSAIFDWARPQQLPVVVVPGADHFFTGKLPVLRRQVASYLERPPASTEA